MEQAVQIVGEEVMYRQEVVADVIPNGGASWYSDPVGPVLDAQQDTATDTRVLFESDALGSYVLTAEVNLASGQKRKGQIRIDVVDKIV